VLVMARSREVVLLSATLLGLAQAQVMRRVECQNHGNETIYGYNATTVDGNKTVSFDEFKGKAVLIFNVATY